ncbi:MAG: MBL fold metallo-hydrolase [Oscillospiraceae bacterium]
MAKFATLYSGSSGNCTAVYENGKAILIDMGASCKRTVGALQILGLSADDVEAVFVTHEHSDHIAGLAIFLKYHKVPLYTSAATLSYLKLHALIPKDCECHAIDGADLVTVGPFSVRAFCTSHDSADCCGYRIALPSGGEIAVATDLGVVSEDVYDNISGCELVALESNYDENMLRFGPYPAYLKARIMSSQGHLSNSDCAKTAARLAESGTKRLVLMHLSKENNEPQIALTSCFSMLENYGFSQEDFCVYIAPRNDVGEILEL